MQENSYTLTGTVIDGKQIALDQSLPWQHGKVRVVVQPLAPAAARSYAEVLGDIRQRQEARGHRPASRAEVDAALQAERDSWET
jgi:hypothetical protein